MARGRMLSKSFSTSERRGRLHELYPPAVADYAQSLYMLTIAHTDDWGRAAGDAFTVKYDIDPISRHGLEDVTQALEALAAVGLIVRYREGDHWWMAIVDFDPHQAGLHKRTPSRIPEPPRSGTSGNFPEVPGNSGSSRKFPEVPGNSGSSRKFPEVPGVPGNSRSRARAELNGMEWNGMEEK